MDSLVTARAPVFVAGLAIQQTPATYGFPNADFCFIGQKRVCGGAGGPPYVFRVGEEKKHVA
jgi:hypothetical protein